MGLIQPARAPEHFPAGTKERSDAELYLERAKVFIPKDQWSSLPSGSLVRNNNIMNDHFALSGKMKVLEKLLRRIEIEGGRVLIFSTFTSTLDFIQSFIQSAGYTFLRMDGTTPQKKRKGERKEPYSQRIIQYHLFSLTLTNRKFLYGQRSRTNSRQRRVFLSSYSPQKPWDWA